MKLIGFDIGGSHIRIAEFELFKLKHFKKIKTPANIEAFEEIISSASKNADFVGISIAGTVSGTKILKSPNIFYLKNFDFKKVVEGKLAVDNDARAFARAEAWARKGVKNILAFTIGTGVGRAYVKNGLVQKIKSFENPEKWESEYQTIFDKGELASYLSLKLSPIIRKYDPELIVFGGGVTQNPGFFARLKNSLSKAGIKSKVEKQKMPDYAAAWGACLPLLAKAKKLG